jgi:hypothetical protein
MRRHKILLVSAAKRIGSYLFDSIDRQDNLFGISRKCHRCCKVSELWFISEMAAAKQRYSRFR